MEQTQTNKRCEFFQNIQHRKLTFCIEGSDMQITATLFSNERDRTITASFFFASQKCPVVPFGVGDELRLIGTHLQKWNNSLQLTGKNIRFGHSLVSMSLSDAIEAWKYVTREQPILFLRKHIPGAQRHFPKLTLMVIVKRWGIARKMEGAQLMMIALILYSKLIRVVRW
jgi:hypothetical protein